MPTWLSWEMLIAGTGALMVAAGVVVCAWAVLKKANKPYRRTLRFTSGTLLTLIGAYIALKKYIDDSGWGQWIESMMEWLIPLFGTTLIVVGVVVFFWAMWADRARGRKRCPKCWYDMSAVPTLTCPECGRDARKPERLLHTRRQWRMAFLALALAGLGSTQFAEPWYRRGGWLPYIPTRVLIYSIPSFESNRSRWMWELDKRLLVRKTGVSYDREELPRLAPLTDSSRAALSRTAVLALAANPKHPAKQMLFELMPEYLQAKDIGSAQPVVLAALTDTDPMVRMGAIVTLRKVKGFDPVMALNGVLKMIAASGAAASRMDTGSLAEGAEFLGEVGASDARVVPALVSLLPGSGSYFDSALTSDVLWALSRMGPAARPVEDDVRALPKWVSYPLRVYTLARIDGTHGDRDQVLISMLHDPTLDQLAREFAIDEMGVGPSTGAVDKELAALLDNGELRTRLHATDALLSLGKGMEAAQAMLVKETKEAELDPVEDWGTRDFSILRRDVSLASILEIYIHHGLDPTPVEVRGDALMERLKRNLSELRAKDSVRADQREAAFLAQFQAIKKRIADYRAGRVAPDQANFGGANRRR